MYIICKNLSDSVENITKDLPQHSLLKLSSLTGKPPKKRLKWTLSLASKLVNKMLEYTQMKLEELKNKQLETQIWHKLEKDMDQDKDHLQRFWYCCLHVQLFVRCDVKLIKLKKKVFKM